MADFPTYRDLFRIARNEVLSRNARVTRDAIETDGTDANAFTASAAAVGDEVVGQLARVRGDLFAASATKEKLDRLLIDRYGLYRKPAAPGYATLTWSTTAPNPTGFDVPSGTRVGTQDGRVWVTVAAVTFPAASTGPVYTVARSIVAGRGQQVVAGALTTIIDKPAGSPADLAVTNALASAGAADAEDDDDYRDRGRRFFTSARRGTLGAIQQAALAFPGVRRASVFEAIDTSARPARIVELVLADAFVDQLVGQTTPPSYATQAQAFALQVIASLDEARAAGIYVYGRVAQVVMLPVQLGLTFVAGVDVDDVAFRARAAIVGYVNTLSPGQPFSRVDASAVLQSVTGLVVSGSEVFSPVGNVVPKTLQVLRTSLSYVAATSLQPDAALQGSTSPDGRAG